MTTFLHDLHPLRMFHAKGGEKRRRYRPGQYTAISFTEVLLDGGMAPSVGTVGDALDNALIE